MIWVLYRNLTTGILYYIPIFSKFLNYSDRFVDNVAFTRNYIEKYFYDNSYFDYSVILNIFLENT